MRRQSASRAAWWRGDEEGRRGESCGTDFTNKCRRLNPGMSQDGSLSLNHRLPAAYLPPLVSRIAPSRTAASIVLSSSPLRPFCWFLATSSFAEAPPPPWTVPFQRAARQFATCLRSCDPLVLSLSLFLFYFVLVCLLLDVPNLASTRSTGISKMPRSRPINEQDTSIARGVKVDTIKRILLDATDDGPIDRCTYTAYPYLVHFNYDKSAMHERNDSLLTSLIIRVC